MNDMKNRTGVTVRGKEIKTEGYRSWVIAKVMR